MRAISVASKLSARKPSAAVAASPASFQPLNAHTSAGLRSSGRSRHSTWSMGPPYRRRPAATPGLVRAGPQYGGVATTTDERIPVARLRAGGPIEGVFACTRKDRMTARTGTAYLAIELRDRSGAIPARAFRDADYLAGQFERGDLVRVSGRVERFRDELTAELTSIARVGPDAAEGVDPAEFLPAAYRDLDELDGFLDHLGREVYDPPLRALVDSFLGDGVFRAGLCRAPCTRAAHHAYLGGLL